jgi:hypothetical protein
MCMADSLRACRRGVQGSCLRSPSDRQLRADLCTGAFAETEGAAHMAVPRFAAGAVAFNGPWSDRGLRHICA